jgi:hypothetical protein
MFSIGSITYKVASMTLTKSLHMDFPWRKEWKLLFSRCIAHYHMIGTLCVRLKNTLSEASWKSFKVLGDVKDRNNIDSSKDLITNPRFMLGSNNG